jgi:hypothetical protein
MKKFTVLLIVLFMLVTVTVPVRADAAEVSPITRVDFDNSDLAVVWAEDHKAPDQDNALGLITGYQSLGFIAHDYLAGDHIKQMYIDELVKITYSNGATAFYKVFTTGSVPANTQMGQVYYESDVIVFQTCMENNLRFIVKARLFEQTITAQHHHRKLGHLQKRRLAVK